MKTAKQIMTKRVHTASPNESVEKIINRMAKEGITGLPVINKTGRLLGIITEGDIAKHEHNPHTPRAISLLGGLIYLENPEAFKEELKKICAQKAKDLMTTEVTAIEPNTTLEEIIGIMQEKKLSRLPVIDKNSHLKGIVTRTDIVRALGKK